MIERATLEYSFDEEQGFGEPPAAGSAGPDAGTTPVHADDPVHVRPGAAAAKASLALAALGGLVLVMCLAGGRFAGTWLGLAGSFGAIALGLALYFWFDQRGTEPGIRHDGVFFGALRNRGLAGWAAGICMTGFYVVLYFHDDWTTRGFAGLLGKPLGLWNLAVQPLAGRAATPLEGLLLYAVLGGAVLGAVALCTRRGDALSLRRLVIQIGAALLGSYALLWALAAATGGRAMPDLFARPAQVLDPLARALGGSAADRWFLYGFLYTLLVLVFGARVAMKYRHNRYQLVRTASVCVFQLGFAFVLPQLLKQFAGHEFYFTYFWPLKREALFPDSLGGLWESGNFGMFLAGWWIIAAIVLVPILTYYFGKRWYCSWVCGCGGLAETLGDPWRQQSDKSERAWVLERWTIHAVLVAITVSTALLWILRWSPLEEAYGFFIGAVFSGVVGVGFYPLLGSRVWCRFGCPQAAILGILQRCFSRFRITTNGAQCMSCGNCSTYCEMGIDVRAYAERGENVVRASCVGCGVCAAVCPRGVLKLENGATHAARFAGSEDPLATFLAAFGRRDHHG